MHLIGHVKQVQVQRSSLKVGERPQQCYDPSPLLVVSRLLLTKRGAIGITADGERIIDVHHADHPASGYRGENGLSLGFTTHYQKMRTRFGPHLRDGIAGENILIEDVGREFRLDELAEGIAIKDATGQLVLLAEIEVATPCTPFSQFAAGETLSKQGLKETLQFLHYGRRGFYATLAEKQQEAEVQAGYSVYAL
jgi:hypothetical protein